VNVIRNDSNIYLVDDDGCRHRVHDYVLGLPHSQPGKRKRSRQAIFERITALSSP
jgi:hypothetical protein